MGKIVYQLGYGEIFAGSLMLDDTDLSPFRADEYIVPGGCVEIEPPVYGDGHLARWVDGGWVIEAIPTPPEPVPPTQEELAAYLATRRWKAEIGGTVWNGWNLPTDDRSQSKYLAELAAVNEDVRQDGQLWKFPHGFEPLTNQQVRDMAIAARAHVLGCFAKEAEVAALIVSGIVTTTEQIDEMFAV